MIAKTRFPATLNEHSRARIDTIIQRRQTSMNWLVRHALTQFCNGRDDRGSRLSQCLSLSLTAALVGQSSV